MREYSGPERRKTSRRVVSTQHSRTYPDIPGCIGLLRGCDDALLHASHDYISCGMYDAAQKLLHEYVKQNVVLAKQAAR
jgi:hypothetical protein